MKITDLKCTVLGSNPVVRITTDEGISGLGEVEGSKHYLKPHIMFYKDFIVGGRSYGCGTGHAADPQRRQF